MRALQRSWESNPVLAQLQTNPAGPAAFSNTCARFPSSLLSSGAASCDFQHCLDPPTSNQPAALETQVVADPAQELSARESRTCEPAERGTGMGHWAAARPCQLTHSYTLTFPCTSDSASARKSIHNAQAGTKTQPTAFSRAAVTHWGVQPL